MAKKCMQDIQLQIIKVFAFNCYKENNEPVRSRSRRNLNNL